MKTFILNHRLRIIGTAVGIIAGYLYYHYIGCITGTCPITSNPYRMMIYGGIIGFLLFDLFKTSKKQTKTDKKCRKKTTHFLVFDKKASKKSLSKFFEIKELTNGK